MSLQGKRHLPLEGAYNIRDIGGYPTASGATTRWRTFLRADSLHRLTPAAQHIGVSRSKLQERACLPCSHRINRAPTPATAPTTAHWWLIMGHVKQRLTTNL